MEYFKEECASLNSKIEEYETQKEVGTVEAPSEEITTDIVSSPFVESTEEYADLLDACKSSKPSNVLEENYMRTSEYSRIIGCLLKQSGDSMEDRLLENCRFVMTLADVYYLLLDFL